jgi:DnaJ family protein C protein 14
MLQVLSDFTKKNTYDDQLRKEESRKMTQRSRVVSQQTGVEFLSEESRRIQCTKCGNFHLWICTKKSKAKARWCQDCSDFHPAKDGDGWVENKFSSSFKEIPRAFVCAESKVFDVSEWATCQVSV